MEEATPVTLSNKLNFILVILLAIMISIGCSLTQSSTKEETKKSTSGGGENASEDNVNTAEEIEDKEKETSEDDKKSVAVTQSDSKQTVVKFGKGKTSAGYENAVIRAESHTYVLGASKGQEMSVNINSLEDNAVFRIKSPSGKYSVAGTEEEGVKNFNDILPESGNYKIIVTPTRGNATFKINFSVSVKEKPEPPIQSGGSTKVVKFRKGGTSATYSNAVIRGDRDTYILGASGGQVMTVNISSLENNAVFDIIAPNGRTLAGEVANWSGQLPANGNYRIIVGGTRGNATYKVTFAIR